MRFLLGVLMLMISGSALATIDVLQFKDEAQEQQFRQLTEELRCPKCQNNSIADSNSMIATDLRQKVYELIEEAGLNTTQDEIHFLPFWENGVKFFTIEGPNKEKVEFSQYL